MRRYSGRSRRTLSDPSRCFNGSQRCSSALNTTDSSKVGVTLCSRVTVPTFCKPAWVSVNRWMRAPLKPHGSSSDARRTSLATRKLMRAGTSSSLHCRLDAFAFTRHFSNRTAKSCCCSWVLTSRSSSSKLYTDSRPVRRKWWETLKRLHPEHRVLYRLWFNTWHLSSCGYNFFRSILSSHYSLSAHALPGPCGVSSTNPPPPMSLGWLGMLNCPRSEPVHVYQGVSCVQDWLRI